MNVLAIFSRFALPLRGLVAVSFSSLQPAVVLSSSVVVGGLRSRTTRKSAATALRQEIRASGRGNCLFKRAAASFQTTTLASSQLSEEASNLVTSHNPKEEPTRVKMFTVLEKVELTEMEQRIFSILTATLKHFNLKTQLRVAGGWVRDKLIGKHCMDIDIALDDMLGRVFCEKVNEYLQIIGEVTHSVGVISRNPSQSKHLETANMRILGISIDFVNLRAETYAENSRIPQMEFGTPEQDAFRRDLTINSLFYNINTGTVEDFTKRGLADLRSGIICTPLSPESTFLDDPLRVCRAIRFGSRFQFKLDEELKKAAASEAVRTALACKVSRERIGHEIELMLAGQQPEQAMHYLDDLNLFSSVFHVDPKAQPDPQIPENYGRLCVETLQAAVQVMAKFPGAKNLTKEQRHIVSLGALFLPLRSSTCLDNKGKKKIAVSTHIICKSLKLKISDAAGVELLHKIAQEFNVVSKLIRDTVLDGSKDVKESIQREDPEIAALAQHRVQLGLLMRETKELWRGALLLSTLIELPSVTSQRGASAIVGLSVDNEKWIDERGEICNLVENVVIKLGLTDVWKQKVLLDGKEIMNALKLEAGTQVQEWKNKVLLWQLDHPNATTEDCLEWLHEENVKRMKV